MARVKSEITKIVVAAAVKEHLRDARMSPEAVGAAAVADGLKAVGARVVKNNGRRQWDPEYRENENAKVNRAYHERRAKLSPAELAAEKKAVIANTNRRRALAKASPGGQLIQAAKVTRKVKLRDERERKKAAQKEMRAGKPVNNRLERALAHHANTRVGADAPSRESSRIVARAEILAQEGPDYGRTMTIRHSMDRMMMLNDYIRAYVEEKGSTTLRSFYSYLNGSRVLDGGAKSPYVSESGELAGDKLKRDISLLADEPTVLRFFNRVVPEVIAGDGLAVARQAIRNMADRYPDQIDRVKKDLGVAGVDPSLWAISGRDRSKLIADIAPDVVVKKATKGPVVKGDGAAKKNPQYKESIELSREFTQQEKSMLARATAVGAFVVACIDENKKMTAATLKKYLAGELVLRGGLKTPYLGRRGFDAAAFNIDMDVIAGKGADQALFLEKAIYNAGKGHVNFVARKAEAAIAEYIPVPSPKGSQHTSKSMRPDPAAIEMSGGNLSKRIANIDALLEKNSTKPTMKGPGG